MKSAWKEWHLKKEGSAEPEAARLEQLLHQDHGRRILDVGCGTGRHVIYFAEKGFEVFGFDASQETVERARLLLAEKKLHANLRTWDMRNPFPYGNESFHAAIAARVIHHTYASEIMKILEEINRVLKPNGLLFLQVPSYEAETTDADMPWVEPGTLIGRWGPEKGVPHHFFRKNELLNLLSGYAIEQIHADTEHYHGYCLIARKKQPANINPTPTTALES
jgi:SAM-dependent methyltransferase